jgi:hypothetical protein
VVFFRGDGSPGKADVGVASGPFFIGGFSQGQIPFNPQHLLLGAAGPLLHPDPQRVMAIGVGSGGSPWGALVDPRVQTLRAVEIVGPVLTVLQGIAEHDPGGVIAALQADPRLRLEYGDGRRAVAALGPRYDVIEADAIRPETSHSGLLYSREFMEQVRQRLAPGGLYVQWAPTWRTVETFAAVFPHSVMIRPANIMIGSDAPIPADVAQRLLDRLVEPAVTEHLARGGSPAVTSLIDADRTLVWRPGDQRQPAPLTDMRPLDEFFVNNGIAETWEPEPAPHVAEIAR